MSKRIPYVDTVSDAGDQACIACEDGWIKEVEHLRQENRELKQCLTLVLDWWSAVRRFFPYIKAHPRGMHRAKEMCEYDENTWITRKWSDR